MTSYLPQKFLTAVAVYVLFGILIGFWVTVGIVGEDIEIGIQCTSLSQCWRLNAYILPASAIIWPWFAFSQPVIIVVFVGYLFLLIRTINPVRPKSADQ